MNRVRNVVEFITLTNIGVLGLKDEYDWYTDEIIGGDCIEKMYVDI